MSSTSKSALGKRKESESALRANGTVSKKAASGEVYPLFKKPGSEPATAVRWLPKLGAGCVHGVHLTPPSYPKVAMFDVDGSIIVVKSGAKWPKDENDWTWWRPLVPKKLKEIHEAKFSIVFVSNQGGFARNPKKAEQWKQKISNMAKEMVDVPFRVFGAGAYDSYRKPGWGTWLAVEKLFHDDGVVIDKSSSYFVGDAAGRVGDHDSTDRKYALNVGLPFFTPEEYFFGQAPRPFTLAGFHPSSLPADTLGPMNKTVSVLPADLTEPELVLFVGYPSSGKSTYYRRQFQPSGYEHVNQDKLKSRPNCLKAVKTAIEAGKSCVVDNTNRDRATRKEYTSLAAKLGAPVRCFYFTCSYDLAYHNNVYRAYFYTFPSSEEKRGYLSSMIFKGFQKAFEEPKVEEGFTELVAVNWLFVGTDVEREHWNKWMPNLS